MEPNTNPTPEAAEDIKIPVVADEEVKQEEAPVETEEQPKEEAPEEEQEEEEDTPEEEEDGDEEEDSEDSDDSYSFFDQFKPLRSALEESGVDMSEMDKRFAEDALTDEDYQTIASAHGENTKVEEVKKVLEIAKENMALTQEARKKAQEIEKARVEEYYSKLDEVAGGDHKELLTWAGTNSDPKQVAKWQAILNSHDPELQMDVIAEMREARLNSQPANVNSKTDSSSNLALLGQSTSASPKPSAPEATEQAGNVPEPSSPLAGNPYESLINGSPLDHQNIANIALGLQSGDKVAAKQFINHLYPNGFVQ